ncbi:ABC transporter permease [Radiobacillus sp. PE A8.2]|uniref:ABC transporter permease n=1 Tax=Radiobacillus sp. PE A8.2 TaxID=3380349 RepID=UPI00388F0680
MKKVWALASFEWKRVFVKPQSYLIMFAMPLLFTFMFGSLFQGSTANLPTIAIVDQEDNNLSRSLIDQLEEKQMMEILSLSLEEAEKQFEDNQLSGIINIQQGYQDAIVAGEVPTVAFQHAPAFNEAMTINQIVSDQIRSERMLVEASISWGEATATSWENQYKILSNQYDERFTISEQITFAKNNQPSMDNISSRSAGFAIMFVMIVIMSVAGTLLDAQKTGVWLRLLATPTTRLQLLNGYLLAFFLIGWMQFAILMLLSSWLFDVYWGNLAAVSVLVSALLLCVVGLALLIGSFAKTSEQQSVLGNVVIISTCMLAGVYWPLEIVPSFMQTIAEFIPQTWAMKGFNEVIARGGSLLDITLPIIILLAFSAVFLLIGSLRVKFD